MTGPDMQPLDTPEVAAKLDVETENNTNTGIRDDSNTCRGNNGVNARRRSRSVASASPSVETVVVKAKRAASSLWMLLHAQNCVLGAGKCPHTGCLEAKLLHLHLKTCPAGTGFECPTHRKGCDQARQLLAHYRRCRSIRARQAGQHPSRRVANQQHACLVCSLVARQAKIMLEGVGSRSLSKTSSTLKPARPVVASFMLDGDNKILPTALNIMPPPPPRAFKWSAKVADASANSKQQAKDDSEGMAPPFARSVDSSRGSFMDQARVRERSVSNAGVAGEGFQWSSKVADAHANSMQQALDDTEGMMAPPSSMMAPPFPRTAALEISVDNCKGSSFVEQQARGRDRSVSNADVGGESSDKAKAVQRTRSASVGSSPAGIAPSGSCDTILEEESNEAVSGVSATEAIDLDFDIDLAREHS